MNTVNLAKKDLDPPTGSVLSKEGEVINVTGWTWTEVKEGGNVVHQIEPGHIVGSEPSIKIGWKPEGQEVVESGKFVITNIAQGATPPGTVTGDSFTRTGTDTSVDFNVLALYTLIGTEERQSPLIIVIPNATDVSWTKPIEHSLTVTPAEWDTKKETKHDFTVIFEDPKTGELVIAKTWVNPVDGNAAVFEIYSDQAMSNLLLTIAIAGEEEKATITGLTEGTYWVKERTDWSWKYNCTNSVQEVEVSASASEPVKVTFENTLDKTKPGNKWLSADAFNLNFFNSFDKK